MEQKVEDDSRTSEILITFKWAKRFHFKIAHLSAYICSINMLTVQYIILDNVRNICLRKWTQIYTFRSPNENMTFILV